MTSRHRAKTKHRKTAPSHRRLSPQPATSAAPATAPRSTFVAPTGRGQGTPVAPGFYENIARELKTIAVIAGTIFVVLIALSLFL